MLSIETLVILICVVIALVCPSLGSIWFENVEKRFTQLARRRTLAFTLVGCLSLALRAAFLPIEPIPQPVVHDEFGYLLAADTFAHSRLTNPTHPLWKHFESFNIIQRPAYQSYPQPAQALVLAAGMVLTGNPFWGVWFSAGVMCAAICWMLQGWMPAQWALLGGIIAVFRLGVFSYWANSYWGGALGATGGALVLGALPRIKRSRRLGDAVVLAFGLVLLANTRPYEGFVFSVPVMFALLLWMLGKNGPALTFPFVMLLFTLPYGFSWRDVSVNTRFLLLLLVLLIIALEVECFYAPHYPAPITCVLLALVLIAMRRLKNWNSWGKPSGLFLARAVPLICLLMFVVRASAGPLHIHVDEYYT